MNVMQRIVFSFRQIAIFGATSINALVTTCHVQRDVLASGVRTYYFTSSGMPATTAEMPSSSVKMVIRPKPGVILVCKPNLMPFHINYNGPAAVSTFMHVEKLVESVESPGIRRREPQVSSRTARRVPMSNCWM
jgi:hypothetical protein